MCLSQIYHKLLSLEQFIEGKPPIIKCSGEQREFIMKIRNGPLEVSVLSYNKHVCVCVCVRACVRA